MDVYLLHWAAFCRDSFAKGHLTGSAAQTSVGPKYYVPCTYVHGSLYCPAVDKHSCTCAGLTGMLDINLLGCRRVSELRPLRALSRLTALSLRNCDGLGDAALAPLSGLLSLASLDLSGCTHLTGAG